METKLEQPLRVLLADDDEDDRTFFREALNELSISTALQTVEDGVALLKLLVPEVLPAPHLLFLDLNMPGKNGKECLKEIRSLAHMKRTPIIIFSTSSSYIDVEETFRNGASLYVQKPSGFDKMVKLLDKVFRIDWDTHLSRADRNSFLFS
jgi:CheY-like chemotaxis protein